MRETEKFAKTMNDGIDISISIAKWIGIFLIVTIAGGALIATLLS